LITGLEGFRITRGPAGRLWILREGAPFLPDPVPWDSWLSGREGAVLTTEGGRSVARVLSLGPNEEVVLRVYRHGGFLARFSRGLFFGVGRPLRELRVSESIRRAGLATPEIVALYSKRALPGLFRSCVLTRRIPESQNLRQWLREDGGNTARWDTMIDQVARALSGLHDAGCRHRDLNLGNLLTAPTGIWIIDLDGAQLKPRLNIAERGANLMRLFRSLCKESGRAEPLSSSMRVRFLRHYAKRDRRLLSELSRWLRQRWTMESVRRKFSRKRRRRN
jgi:tRNA A-37 threonylcarbamoyl transferase component Bud32